MTLLGQLFYRPMLHLWDWGLSSRNGLTKWIVRWHSHHEVDSGRNQLFPD
ncbi:Putative LOC100002286 [Caligus rogercresseyi]|uniref:LOC100002286 n=1 Tax=Caligus rogercresseyi TaxID=217165 RepID=A0A7T8H2X1_CALRO|nr:Putative LOC100002286 [Caligus rogercresseyi]